MPCNCSKAQYTVSRPDGTQSTYRTEYEAQADVLRNGGAYSAS